MANTYDTGDQIRITGTFTNSTSVTVDPTAIVYKHKDPSGNTATLTYGTDPQPVRSTKGIYYVDLTLDEAGIWHDRWAGTGTAVAAAEHYWFVRDSEF